MAVSSTSNPSVQLFVYVTALDRHCNVTLSLNSDARILKRGGLIDVTSNGLRCNAVRNIFTPILIVFLVTPLTVTLNLMTKFHASVWPTQAGLALTAELCKTDIFIGRNAATMSSALRRTAPQFKRNAV